MANHTEFLECIASVSTHQLYMPGQQSCIPVFRALNPASATILTRMLYLEVFSNDILLAQCPNLDLSECIKYNLIRRNPDKSIAIDQHFSNALKLVIEGKSVSALKMLAQSQESPEQLQKECSIKWKSLFNLISQSDPAQAHGYRPRIQETFRKSGLLDRNRGVGFQFILTSTHKQINQMLTYYVKASHQKPETIRFILALCVLDPRNMYEAAGDFERDIILDLQELGLTQQIGPYVRITYLLWNFLYAEPVVSIDIKCNLIVEANFRIYAYLETRDKMEESILYNLLSLFSEIRKQFPNLIIADLSDLSMKRACKRNLKAEQIIQFLEMNNKRFNETKSRAKVSEEYKKRLGFLRVFQEGPSELAIIPHNVVQQLRFWEEEEQRQI